MTANYTFAPNYPQSGAPDPAVQPWLYEGAIWRRLAAYLIDLLCIGAIATVLWLVFMVLTVVSFGLLGPLLWFLFGLIPLAYHTLLLSGPRSATFGMRCFDLQLLSWNGERPGFLQALVQTVLFYLTVGITGSLILLFVLLNRRRRTLHDVLANTVMVRARPMLRPRDPWHAS
ncbi:MAG: RDD family protein [Alphaproteobacteria bacterium]|nr:RDD family protein [Alphaproteobacteria bacterium]